MTKLEAFASEQLKESVPQFKIGDTIKVASGTEDDIKDTVKETSYKIVGSGSIPYYLSLDR